MSFNVGGVETRIVVKGRVNEVDDVKIANLKKVKRELSVALRKTSIGTPEYTKTRIRFNNVEKAIESLIKRNLYNCY